MPLTTFFSSGFEKKEVISVKIVFLRKEEDTVHLNLMRIVDFHFRVIDSLINEEETFKSENASEVYGSPHGFSFILSLHDFVPFLTSGPINEYSFIYIALIVSKRRNPEHQAEGEQTSSPVLIGDVWPHTLCLSL